MKYTAHDIMRMRNTIKSLLSEDGGSYNRMERTLEVETQLVTYMSAEVTPDELAAELDNRRQRRAVDRANYEAYKRGVRER